MVTDEQPVWGGESVGGDRRDAAPTRLYVGPDRDQMFLLPVCMRDWLDRMGSDEPWPVVPSDA